MTPGSDFDRCAPSGRSFWRQGARAALRLLSFGRAGPRTIDAELAACVDQDDGVFEAKLHELASLHRERGLPPRAPLAIDQALSLGQLERFERLLDAAPLPDPSTLARIAALAPDPAFLRALLDRGADVESPSPSGSSLLALACSRNLAATAQLLIERGAALDALDHNGFCAFDRCLLDQEPACAQTDACHALLAAGANPFAGSSGARPVSLAIRAKDAPLARLLIELCPDRPGWISHLRANSVDFHPPARDWIQAAAAQFHPACQPLFIEIARLAEALQERDAIAPPARALASASKPAPRL